MDKVITLIVSIIMPPQVPDVQRPMVMPSMEACWESAKVYMEEQKLTDAMREQEALGIGAMCAYVEKPSQKN